jgi:apolipoprotein D and lipocalin family protein
MLKSTLLATAALFLAGCQSAPRPPIALAGPVDLPRFMGDWYVIANIPTFLEKGAHNAVESYRLDADGSIATTFTFRADAFDGPEKRYTPRGFVREGQGNAVWGMRFLWPIKADFRIVYLDSGLRPDRDRPRGARLRLDHGAHAGDPGGRLPVHPGFLAGQGYDVTRIQRVPQRWEKQP